MKIKHIFSLFLCAGLMLSCAKEIEFAEECETVLRDGYRWLEVSLAMENPKTIIAGSGSTKNIEWTQGDKIDFFWGSGSDEKTTITLKVGGPAANMRVQVPEAVTDVYAAYPSGAATFSEGTLSFEMPGVESGEFSKVNFMASKIVADSENGKKTAVFRSVVSFLKFTVSDPNAKKIEIRARAEENPVLRGTFPVTFDADNNIQIGEVSSPHQTYTMNIGGAGDFYAPILPGKLYADGFELNYYVNNLNTKYYDVDFDFKLDRGFIANFGTVETLFKANAIHEYYVTVSGAGNKDGSSWANAMGKDEFKEKIAGISISKDTDSEEVKAAEDYLKNAIFHIEGGTYDFGNLVELGFSNHCKKYINFTFDGGYYNGSKDVQNPTVFDGGGTHRIFELARYTDLAVMDCTFSNSYGTGGGQAAIRMASKYSKLNLSGCTLKNNLNTATAGAINVGYGTVNLTNCTFSGNSATYGAAINVANGASGAIDLTGEVVISNCTFDGNSATDAGGALRLSEGGPVSVTGCEFYNNSSKFGGAVHAGKANSTFTNCIFGSPDNGNTATGSGARGGAVRCSGDSGNHVFNNCTFSGNAGGYGGAIFMEDFSGTVTVNGGTFTANHAASSSGIGGGIYQSSGTLSVDGATFSENTTEASGGALGFNNGVATLTACTFTGNTSKTYGAAVYAVNGTLTLTNCVIGTADSGNTATKSGGAFRFQDGAGSAELNNCTIAYNASSSNGGAISLAGTYTGIVTINGGAISNCSATGNEGGAIRQESGTIVADGLYIDNCSAKNGAAYSITGGSATFTKCYYGKNGRNAASEQGGCIHMKNSAAPEFEDCYFSGYGANGGGVGTNNSSHPTFTNCQFVNCSSDEGGCVYTDDTSYPTFSGCLFQECSVSIENQELGGAVRINNTECHPSFDNCKFENCEAYRGGAVYSDCAYTSGSINFNKCEFTGCYASDEGGCVNMRSSAPVTYNFTDCSFHDNRSPWGALYCNNGNSSYRTTVNVTGGDFTCNIGQMLNKTSYDNGAALYPSSRATFNVSGVRFEGNVADNGPAVFLAAQTSIFNCEDCEFIENEAKTNGGVIFANANTTQFYCNSSVFDNNKAKAGAVYYNGEDGFKAYFNACAFKENNWSDDYGGMMKIKDGDKSNNVLCLNNCSGNHNYSNGSGKTGQQCTWINLPTNNGVKFVIANTSFIGNLQDKNGNVSSSSSSSAPGIIRIDDKKATKVQLYMVNNILMKWDANTNYGVASTIETYAAQYCNYNKGYSRWISGKNEPGGYFDTDGRLPEHFGSLAWDDSSNLWTWNGANSGSYNLGATADINAVISAADSGFYSWLVSIGAISSDGTSAVDARGTTRGSYSWPGAYDKGDKTSANVH